MARPRSNAKRNEIMEAAIRTVAEHGLGASTALIGKSAGVSNGALFTYFETKADLLNQLYVELKARMAAATLVGSPLDAEPREQLQYVWHAMLRWAAERPLERAALAQLSVSKDVTEASHIIGSQPYGHIVELLDQSRAKGALSDASPSFVAALVMAMVDATIAGIVAEPEAGERHAQVGFEALWRVLT